MGATDKNELDRILEVIKTAWQNGRPIIPIIGAGCSVDSGMPVVRGIERYLAQLYLALKHGVYTGLPTPDKEREPFYELVEFYRNHPDQFVIDLQWPDRFILHQNLCATDHLWKDEAGAPTAKSMNDLVKQAFHEMISPTVIWAKDDLPEETFKDGHKLNTLFGNWRALIERFTNFNDDLGDALIQRLHERRRPGPSHRYLAFLARLNLWQTFLTFNFDRFIERALNEQRLPHRVFAMEHGDTFPHELLVHHGLSIVKMHGDTHRLLMDHTLDRPLKTDYLDRLQRCLSQGTSASQPALLVVLGCGGSEERCLSILRHHCERNRGANDNRLVIWVHFESEAPSLLRRCLTPESRKADPANKPEPESLASKLKDRGILTVRARNPGFFLMHLYSHLTNRHPASHTPYLAHIDRPIGFEKEEPVQPTAPRSPEEEKERRRKEQAFDEAPFKVFDGRKLDPENYSQPTASQRLAEYVNELKQDVYPLWIDLEDCYSVVDVIGRFVEQVRRYDTAVAPGVFALDDLRDNPFEKLFHDEMPDDAIAKAVDRVVRILRRGTYCLAFDAVEAFGWPPTAHHGDVENSGAFLNAHRKDLRKFLSTVIAKSGDLRGSEIVVSMDKAKSRFALDETQDFGQIIQDWQDCFDKIRTQLGEDAWKEVEQQPGDSSITIIQRRPLPIPLPLVKVDPTPPSNSTAPASSGDDARSLALFRLATCRRTRQLVALRRLLLPLASNVKKDEQDKCVDLFLDSLTADGILLRVEGGGFWINRPLRDAIYSEATNFASPACLRDCLNCRTNDKLDHFAAQIWLIFAEHDRWADWYHDQHYEHSKDPHAFFEYVYHRVTSLRAITVLCELASRDSEKVANSIKGVTDRIQQLTKHSNSNVTWFHPSLSNVPRGSESICEELCGLRLTRIRWLNAVWKESGTDIAVTTGAERLILWIRWLLVEDLPRTRFPVGDETLALPGNHAQGSTDAANAITELQSTLLQYWYEFALNRMDYKAAAKIAKELESVRKEVAEVVATLQANEDSEKADRLAKTLIPEKTLCAMRLKAEGASLLFQPESGRVELDDLNMKLKQLTKLGKLSGPNGVLEFAASGIIDARIWYLHLSFDAEQFAYAEMSTSKLKMKLNHWEVYLKQTLLALLDSRTSPEFTASEHHKQHVWLLIHEARIRVLQFQNDKSSFEDAYRALEAARTFASDGPLHRQGIVELYAAHAALAHAEHLFTWPLETGENGEIRRSRAASKIASADAALIRAYEYLRGGRRNTRWWRFYFRALAKLAIWQLWAKIAATREMKVKRTSGGSSHTRGTVLENPVLEAERQIAKVLVILRRGLSALRRRMHLQPEPILTIKDLKDKAAYIYSLWEALYRLGYQAVCEITATLGEHGKDYQSVFPDQMKWYTESVGFGIDDGFPEVNCQPQNANRTGQPDLLTVLADTKPHVLTLPHFRWKKSRSRQNAAGR